MFFLIDYSSSNQRAAKDQDEELHLKNSLLEKQAEENKSREAQLKQANKVCHFCQVPELEDTDY
jgi:hypothetical protein